MKNANGESTDTPSKIEHWILTGLLSWSFFILSSTRLSPSCACLFVPHSPSPAPYFLPLYSLSALPRAVVDSRGLCLVDVLKLVRLIRSTFANHSRSTVNETLEEPVDRLPDYRGLPPHM